MVIMNLRMLPVTRMWEHLDLVSEYPVVKQPEASRNSASWVQMRDPFHTETHLRQEGDESPEKKTTTYFSVPAHAGHIHAQPQNRFGWNSILDKNPGGWQYLLFYPS